MVVASAVHDGALLEQAHARGGLAGVDDAGARACDQRGVASRAGGDAGEALHEIQRGPLGDEDGAGRAADTGDLHSMGEAVAIRREGLEAHGRVDGAEDLAGNLDAAQDATGLGEHDGARRPIGRDGGEGGDVPGADILGEGEVDDGADVRLEGRGMRHGGVVVSSLINGLAGGRCLCRSL